MRDGTRPPDDAMAKWTDARPEPSGHGPDEPPDEILVAAFPSTIDLASLHGEEAAAIARLSFEERWLRALGDDLGRAR